MEDASKPVPATEQQMNRLLCRRQKGSRDLYATILQLLGMDHTCLTYPYSGRDMQPTDVCGKPSVRYSHREFDGTAGSLS